MEETYKEKIIRWRARLQEKAPIVYNNFKARKLANRSLELVRGTAASEDK